MPLGIPISATSGGAWATAGSPNYMRDMMAMTAEDVRWGQEMDKFYAGLELSERRLEEQTRQYDVSLAEEIRKFDLQTKELQRQYDLTYGLEREQFEQEKFRWEEQFAESQERWEAEQESAQKQWDEYYESQRFTREQETARWEEEQETLDLKQTLLQQTIDAEGKQPTLAPTSISTPTTTEGARSGPTTSGLWDRSAQWAAMSGTQDLISLQKKEISDYLYPRSYGPSPAYGSFEEERGSEEYTSSLAEGIYDYSPSEFSYRYQSPY